jgi:hypothetical protein
MYNNNHHTSPPLQVETLLDLYRHQAYDQLSEQLLLLLEHFKAETYLEIDAGAQYFIDSLVKNFLYLFTQPDYVLRDDHARRFIELNLTLSNLVAISSFKTTDTYLEILKQQPRNFTKILALYSARNTVSIDRQAIFDSNSSLACLWYSYFCDSYRSALVNPVAYHNLREHLAYEDDRLTDFYNISEIYLGATYIDHDRHLAFKTRINQTIQVFLTNIAAQINNTPNPKKIAIITGKWFATHVVYRTIFKFIETLVLDYELTLVHLGEVIEPLELSLFQQVIYVGLQDGNLNLKSLIENDFMVAYYPDIGMNLESILLSNLRLAPIQITGVGHPISTGGSQIDYFISGAEVEMPTIAQQYYTEKLLLIPGLGAIHQRPPHQIPPTPKNSSRFIVNCPWMSSKVSYPLVTWLKRIAEEAEKPLLFRFFSSGLLRYQNDFLPFRNDLIAILGNDQVELVAYAYQQDYLTLLEQGNIAIDAFYFAGSNTIVDSLYLGQAIVTMEGDRWYNGVGAQLLRRVGLGELVAQTAEDYIDLTVKLINDDLYRQHIEEHLQQINLDETLFSEVGKSAFKETIDQLIANYASHG